MNPEDTNESARRKAQSELEALILEGLKGPFSPMTKEDWASIRAEGLKRLEARAESKNDPASG
jgi:hypothetical protein